MTFEKEYGEFLTREINAKLGDKIKCKQYDAVAYKAGVYDETEIALMFDGGNARRTNIAGLDKNVLPFSVTAICNEVYAINFIKAVNEVQKNINAVPLYLKCGNDNESNVYLKSIFTTPFIMSTGDYATKTQTIKVAYIQFSATVTYGETAMVEPAEFSLVLDNVEYDINYLYTYDISTAYSYDTSLAQGNQFATNNKLAKTIAYIITVFKSQNDPLQTLFANELKNKEDNISDKTIVLNYDGESIPITSFKISESYTPDGSAYTIELGR